MKESSFWRKLRPLMLEAAPGIVVERVESWSTPSFPDVSGTYAGKDFWIELKIERKRRVKMRPGQVRWLTRRWKAGSRCFVLVDCERHNRWLLIEGKDAKELSKKNPHTVEHTLYSPATASILAMLARIYDGR